MNGEKFATDASEVSSRFTRHVPRLSTKVSANRAGRRVGDSGLPCAGYCWSVKKILRLIRGDLRSYWSPVRYMRVWRTEPVHPTVGFRNEFSLRANRLT